MLFFLKQTNGIFTSLCVYIIYEGRNIWYVWHKILRFLRSIATKRKNLVLCKLTPSPDGTIQKQLAYAAMSVTQVELYYVCATKKS